MTDPWAEKPEIMRKTFEGIRVYMAQYMDEWLEKLKAELDRLQKEGLEHHAIAVEYYEKLEAVKTQLTSIPEEFILQAYVVLNRGTDEHHLWNFEIWYTDLKKILEAED